MGKNHALPSGFAKTGRAAILARGRAVPVTATGKLFPMCAQASTGFAMLHANRNRLAHRPLAHAARARHLRTERVST